MRSNSSDTKGFAYCKELLQLSPLATPSPNICYNCIRRVEHLHAFPPAPKTMTDQERDTIIKQKARELAQLLMTWEAPLNPVEARIEGLPEPDQSTLEAMAGLHGMINSAVFGEPGPDPEFIDGLNSEDTE